MRWRRGSPTGASPSMPRWGGRPRPGSRSRKTAAEQDADAVVMELGTNDSSAAAFRGYLVETLDTLTTVPLVIWQTAKGPGGATEHPGSQRGDPRGRADLPERGDRRLGRLRPRGRLPGGRDPPGRGLRAARVRAPAPDALRVARRNLERRERPRADGRSCATRPDPLPRRERAGGAGIKRLVCIVLGPPDLTWPGGLSMPPAARLARGFCSPRSYLSIALSTVHPPDRGSANGRVRSPTRPDAPGGRRAARPGRPPRGACPRRPRARSGGAPARPWAPSGRDAAGRSNRAGPTACSRRCITASSGLRRSRYSASETISPMRP